MAVLKALCLSVSKRLLHVYTIEQLKEETRAVECRHAGWVAQIHGVELANRLVHVDDIQLCSSIATVSEHFCGLSLPGKELNPSKLPLVLAAVDSHTLRQAVLQDWLTASGPDGQ